VSYAQFAKITKTYRDDDGVLHFEASKATGPDLDLDGQIADPEWAKTAMEEWFKTGGNLREQHSHIAAGKALTLEHRDDGEYISGAVVDPTSAKKVEAGVLTGLSIGIKNGRVIKDASAPNGRIVAGSIVETSLVDRPCVPTAKLVLAKAAMSGDCEFVEQLVDVAPDTGGKAADPDQGKKDYSDKERADMAEEGQAMAGGGYPIKTVTDLKNAIQAIGRAKDPAATRAHIKRRAKALGREDLIPDTWKADDADLTKAVDEAFTHDPKQLASIRDGLARLVQAELDELMHGEDEVWDINNLMCSLSTFLCWWQSEAWEGETPSPKEVGDGTKSADPDTKKTAPADGGDTPTTKTPATDPAAAAFTLESVADAVKAATEPLLTKVSSLEAKLAEVEKMAAPGGPSVTRSARQATVNARLETLKADQAHFGRMAASVADPTLAQGYRDKVREVEAEISKIATTTA
jgi:hypothetical protein